MDNGVFGRFVDELLQDDSLNVDPARVYVTGVSMGGAGVWAAGSAYPTKFAAIAPVCGFGSFKVISTPVWAFHGANDIIVPVSETDRMVNASRKAGNPEVKYSRYDESPAPVGWPSYRGHASWLQAYGTNELFYWLLDHKLRS
mmetsp:Transcript_9496/g.15524  ORF Transcript_9496/g.15524 Transcript_9496/m.15524 type:complete len:143 (+) Transcript_9496:552-980(+)